MKPKMKPRRRKKLAVVKNCLFCGEKKNPHYLQVDVLQRFVTERGKIIARSRSGICAKHQRVLALSIKYARHLALMPFIVRG